MADPRASDAGLTRNNAGDQGLCVELTDPVPLSTGGTQGWLGYRAWLDASSPALALEARPAQPGATNASRSLLIPNASSSAPNPLAIGSAKAPACRYRHRVSGACRV